MDTQQRSLTAALFSLFADVIERDVDGSESIKKGNLQGEGPWKICGVGLAHSAFIHGAWRFGGMHHSMEKSAISMLRCISKEINSSLSSNNGIEAIIKHQASLNLPTHVAAGSQVAIGLLDDDSEYSGNMILIELADLANARLGEKGVLLRAGGDEQELIFNFQKCTLLELIENQIAQQHTAAARPRGP